jgi:prevent-host-death family protein
MTSVGIRELKAHLTEYIRRAERGESITITDRGRPVARIGPEPAPKLSTEEKLKQLVAEGLLEWNGEPLSDLEPVARARPGFSVADIVIEQRG